MTDEVGSVMSFFSLSGATKWGLCALSDSDFPALTLIPFSHFPGAFCYSEAGSAGWQVLSCKNGTPNPLFV